MNFKELAAPFPAKDIEWRVSRAGKTGDKVWAFVLAYIDARAVMDRLDEVVGPGNWKDRYWREGNTNFCGLAIKCGDEWVEKVDGSEDTEFEAVKGGISGAFKRAAVKWGIGRYLYNLTESFAAVVDKGTKGARYQGQPKDKAYDAFYWVPPQLPEWALPAGEALSAPKGYHLAAVPSPSDPGDYVIMVGKKFHGVKIKDAKGPYSPEGIPVELESYASWMREKAQKDGRPLTGDYLAAVEAIEAYCASKRLGKAK